jgi:cytochrome c-type biogenesis protein CcmH
VGAGLAAVFLVLSVATASDPSEDRARTIGSQIRCPVCQGESIAESPSQTATNMMDLVRSRIAEGATDDQIISQLLDSYSGALLLDPPVGGRTLWLWVAPILALGVGVMVIARRFRPGSSPIEPDASAAVTPIEGSSGRKRLVAGGIGLGLAAAISLAGVGQFRQNRVNDQSLSGVAAGTVDPATVSNETLEAVIAANADSPQINGMRLALANRYFEEGDYQGAFPHYQAVLEKSPADAEAVVAYSRLGWMVFDGNGEADLALGLIDRGLVLVPGDAFSLYLKGRVVWCGKGDATTAAQLFEEVLTSNDIDPEVRSQVEADLATAADGGACP